MMFSWFPLEAGTMNNWEYEFEGYSLGRYVMVLYTFAMNGHTEKIYGEIPVSRAKIGALFGVIGGLAAMATALLGVLICL